MWNILFYQLNKTSGKNCTIEPKGWGRAHLIRCEGVPEGGERVKLPPRAHGRGPVVGVPHLPVQPRVLAGLFHHRLVKVVHEVGDQGGRHKQKEPWQGEKMSWSSVEWWEKKFKVYLCEPALGKCRKQPVSIVERERASEHKGITSQCIRWWRSRSVIVFLHSIFCPTIHIRWLCAVAICTYSWNYLSELGTCGIF